MQLAKTFTPPRVGKVYDGELINRGLVGLNAEINKIARTINRTHWVDLRDFGGKDGTDNTVAIADAIATEKPIYIPSGSFPFTSIDLLTKTNIIGAGRGQTELLYIGSAGGTVIKTTATGYISHVQLGGFTLNCIKGAGNRADVGIDFANIMKSRFVNILVLSPGDTGFLFNSSRNGTNFDTPCAYNYLENLEQWSAGAVGTSCGFRLINAANSNTFVHCISQHADKGFSLENEVDAVANAITTNNVFSGCSAESVVNYGFWINAEYNQIIAPRVEGVTTAFGFGSHARNRWNIVIQPCVYSATNLHTGHTPVKATFIDRTTVNSEYLTTSNTGIIGTNLHIGLGNNSRGVFFTPAGTYTYGMLRNPDGNVAFRVNGNADKMVLGADGILTIEGGRLSLKESITPSAVADYGKIYTKADNKLYFQDGTGVEHEISLVA